MLKPSKSSPPGVSVVIPCFNSEKTLGPVVEQLAEVLPRCAERFEVILVNDGSRDGSWTVIGELAKRYPWVVGVALMRNYGQHNATLCGVRHARYDVTVTMDDDLQHPPSEIPKILDKLSEGYDLVYGVPDRRTQSLCRYLLSRLFRLAVAVASRQRTVRDLSAYRAYRTSLRRAFSDYRSPQVLIDILLAWGTTNIATVTVTHHTRRAGRSNYSFVSMVNAALTTWTGYTTAPLRFASLVGFLFVVFGMAILIFILVAYFRYGTLPGFPFLASTIAIFGGVQLFTLGIIGEYLARVFKRSLDQPVYVVKQVVGEEAES